MHAQHYQIQEAEVLNILKYFVDAQGNGQFATDSKIWKQTFHQNTAGDTACSENVLLIVTLCHTGFETPTLTNKLYSIIYYSNERLYYINCMILIFVYFYKITQATHL